MKLTKSPDGTIHVEGTPDEVRELLAPPKDAIGKMLVQYPVPGCAPTFAGQVWVGELIAGKPLSLPPPPAAACAAPQSFLWPPPSNAGARS